MIHLQSSIECIGGLFYLFNSDTKYNDAVTYITDVFIEITLHYI